jgi:hypothetical protein
MGRKHGHWGFTEEAKAWATRARRRDEREELSRALADALEPGSEEREPDPEESRLAGDLDQGTYASPQSSPEQSLLTKAAPVATRNSARRPLRPLCIDNEDSSPQVRSISRAIFVVTGQLKMRTVRAKSGIHAH